MNGVNVPSAATRSRSVQRLEVNAAQTRVTNCLVKVTGWAVPLKLTFCELGKLDTLTLPPRPTVGPEASATVGVLVMFAFTLGVFVTLTLGVFVTSTGMDGGPGGAAVTE